LYVATRDEDYARVDGLPTGGRLGAADKPMVAVDRSPIDPSPGKSPKRAPAAADPIVSTPPCACRPVASDPKAAAPSGPAQDTIAPRARIWRTPLVAICDKRD